MKVDLHIHTNYSPCSNLSLSKLIHICKQKGINYIAITDHNTIAGALQLKRILPSDNKLLKIIIGEEITTLDGHIIGLFLKKEISPHMTLEKTISEIKKQGGLVFVPHPFDIFRDSRIGFKKFKKIANQVDIIEIFNGRTIFFWNDKKAKKMSKKYNIISATGSDSHTKWELGRIYTEIENFTSPSDFLQKLKKGKIKTGSTLFYPYIISIWEKILSLLKRKKIFGKN